MQRRSGKAWQGEVSVEVLQENKNISFSFLFFLLLLAIDKQGKLEIIIHCSWQIQDISKGEACLGFDKINNNAKDELHLWPRGRCVRIQCSARQAWVCGARARSVGARPSRST